MRSVLERNYVHNYVHLTECPKLIFMHMLMPYNDMPNRPDP